MLGTLGRGGMGVVYLAEDEGLGRRVAVKAILESGMGAEGRARFQREARAMACVEHPHIVRVYAYGEVEGRPYLVMEYVEGETLAARLAREGSLPVAEALRITREAAEGLSAAAEAGIVHRDVKPSNLLFDPRGRVRVTDFGLAKSHGPEADGGLTPTGDVLGTPHYLAPEQALGRAVDHRADVFALGIVLYEMLAGRRPFGGQTPVAAIAQLLHDDVPPVRLARPEVPEGVAELVAWMTRREPGERPGYAALMERLDAIAAMPAGASPSAPRPGAAAVTGAARGRLGARARRALTLALWGVTLAVLTRQARMPEALPADDVEQPLVVAVAPFYGHDEASAREGRAMAALVEKELRGRARDGEIEVLGIEDAGPPVKGHEAARELGEKLGARAVVWGEAFALEGEAEIQPHVTMVPPKATARTGGALGRPSIMEEVPDGAGQALRIGVAGGADAIELRKTGAAGVSDLVGDVVGLHALERRDPSRALAIFRRAPASSTSLRHQAAALVALGRLPEALAALDGARGLDPGDAAVMARRGDVLLLQERWADAADAYREARALDPGAAGDHGMLHEGLLYVRETTPSGSTEPGSSTAYIVAVDPGSGRVLQRHRCQGIPWRLWVEEGALRARASSGIDDETFDVVIAHGRAQAPRAYEPNATIRLNLRKQGLMVAENFRAPLRGQVSLGPGAALDLKRPVDPCQPDAPQDLDAVTHAAHVTLLRDGTQPWHAFLAGQALSARGDTAGAARHWEAMLASLATDIPYFDLALMAQLFEVNGQPAWADRAFAESLRRRDLMPRHPGTATLFERLVLFPVLRSAALGSDPERAHVWLERSRQLVGVIAEDDDLTAAAWARHFERAGDVARAERERQHGREARRNPLGARRNAVLADALLDVLAASSLALPVALLLLLRRAWGAGSMADGVLAVPTLVLVPVIVTLAATGGDDDRMDLVSGGALLLAAAGLGVVWLPRVARALPALPREAGAVLALAGLVPLAAVIGTGILLESMEARRDRPRFSDSYGHPGIIRSLATRLERSDSISARYVLGVMGHVAGDGERARRMYASIRKNEPRADENARALENGLLPPRTVTARDMWTALRPTPREHVTTVLDVGAPMLAVATLLAALACLPRGLAAAPPRDPSAPRAVRRLVRRLARSAVPGSHDLLAGSPIRGYATLVAALVPVAMGLSIASHPGGPHDRGLPVFGLVTGFALPGAIRELPLPVSGDAPLTEQHFWTFFLAYPYARPFWAFMAACAIASAALHVHRLPAIWRT